MIELEKTTASAVEEGGREGVPPALVLAAAQYHVALNAKADLSVHALQEEGEVLGWLVGVQRGTGRTDSLPDRMYGFVRSASERPLDLDGVYKLLRRVWGGSFRANFIPAELGGAYVGSYKGTTDRYHLSDTFLVRHEDEEGLRRGVRRVARQALQKAERGPLEVRSRGRAGDWMQFLGLHVAKSARHGSPAMGRAEIRALQSVFGDRLGLTLAVLEGTPVAAVVHVQFGEYALMLDNASLREHWGLNPNYLVVWHAMRDLLRGGARVIDMGFSARDDEGGHRFKEHMGGTRCPVFSVTSG